MLESVTNLLLAGLLLVTILACALVYVRLRRLRLERKEMASLIAALIAASERAEAAIRGLREVSGEIQHGLHEQMDQGRHRAAELTRLIDNGGRIAKRMEAALYQGARNLAERAPAPEPVPRAPSVPRVEAEPPRVRPAAEPRREGSSALRAELLKALGALR